MASKTITERQDERLPDSPWDATAEEAPSILREDEPGLARVAGMIGAMLVIFGGMALAFNLSGRLVRVSSAWATLALTLGLAGLLFHAALDRDLVFRRMYMVFGVVALVVGA